MIATVEPVHVQVLRARIGGTVSALKVKEGDRVAAGEEIALITDQKLYLQIQGIDQNSNRCRHSATRPRPTSTARRTFSSMG